MNFELEELFKKYELALKFLENCFDYIDETFSKNGYNPIEHHKGRLKDVNSIKKKLKKRNLLYNANNIENVLSDVVGYRIVCSFLSDIEVLKNVIYEMSNKGYFKIIEELDYIKNPKESGYTSFHFVVLVPIFYNNSIEYVKAEIQLRTMAMDMSFSIEHKTVYKRDKCPIDLIDKIYKTVEFCKIIDNDLDNIVTSKKCKNINNIQNSNSILCCNLYDQVDLEKSLDLELIKLKYKEALKYVKDIFENLKLDYSKQENGNIIEHIKCRLKSNEAIRFKLLSKRLDINLENIEKNVNDFAGIRIVCSFLSDMDNLVAEIYKMQDNGLLEILDIRDYIFEHRKKNGYSGYHFLVRVPICGGVKVEIQLRTVAMELWASLEEKICGSPSCRIINGFDVESMQEYFEIQENLKRTADVLGIFDTELDYIVNKYKDNSVNSENRFIRLKRRK